MLGRPFISLSWENCCSALTEFSSPYPHRRRPYATTSLVSSLSCLTPPTIFVLRSFAPTISPYSTSRPPFFTHLPTQDTMPSVNRLAGRDVHIYDANDPTAVLGGLILSNGVTNANFYFMVGILFIFGSKFSIRDEGRTTIQKDNQPLQPG